MSNLVSLSEFYWTVVITVIAVLMVKSAIDDVVDVITVLDRFVATTRTMDMVSAAMSSLAVRRVSVADFDGMSIAVIPMGVVQFTINQIIYMVTMAYCSMTTVWSMNVLGVRVGIRTSHP